MAKMIEVAQPYIETISVEVPTVVEVPVSIMVPTEYTEEVEV